MKSKPFLAVVVNLINYVQTLKIEIAIDFNGNLGHLCGVITH